MVSNGKNKINLWLKMVIMVSDSCFGSFECVLAYSTNLLPMYNLKNLGVCHYYIKEEPQKCIMNIAQPSKA
jgi:hypothetical protein